VPLGHKLTFSFNYKQYKNIRTKIKGMSLQENLKIKIWVLETKIIGHYSD